MANPIKSRPTLLKQFLSNPIGLVIYGLINALFAAYFSKQIPFEIIFLVITTVIFVGFGIGWAISKQNEEYRKLFPGGVRISRVVVRLTVDNLDGHGEMYTGWEGSNESDMPRRKLIYDAEYCTNDAVSEPVKVGDWLKVDGQLDGKAVKWDAKITRYEVEDEWKHVWLNVYVDLGDSCPPKSKIPFHSYTIKAGGIFLDAFGTGFYYDFTPAGVLTNELIFKLDTESPVRIRDVWEEVKDLWGESDTIELQRLKAKSYAHRTSDNSAILDIRKPIPSDTYYFYFTLENASQVAQS